MANNSYRSNSTRIAVITTDAPFHQAGDGRIGTIFKGYYRGDDYVSIDRLRSALVSSNIVPIFAVTKNVSGVYADLVEQLGVGAVVPLTANPNKLMTVITDVIPSDLVGIVRNTTVESLQGRITYV